MLHKPFGGAALRLPALAVASLVLFAQLAHAQIFGPGDPIIAIDRGVVSSYPPLEGPGNAVDQDSNTKYLNFGKAESGMIITPAFGSSTIQSLKITTANDFEDRDPMTFALYGTNEAIVSADNSRGDDENWTLIAEGDLNPPLARFTCSPFADFANTDSYTSYRIFFPTLRNSGTADSMQVADLQFFTGSGGTGSTVLATGDFAIAVNRSNESDSNYPGGEGPANVIDETLAKYLNFGKQNSGFIVSRSDGASSIVTSFTITTANDAPERDPTSYELYGTNDPITSEDNSSGDNEDWTLIASGEFELPFQRDFESDPFVFTNNTAYTGYRMVFPTVAGDAANSMQIAECTFDGTVIGSPFLAPSSFTTFRGILLEGDLASLTNSDDSYVKYNPGFTINNLEAPVWVIFDANAANDSPASIEIVLESNAGTPGLTVTTEAWNYNTSMFDIIDEQSEAFNTDVVRTFFLSPVADYIESGSAALQTRCGWRKTGFTINFPWEIRIDQAGWNAN